MQSLIYRGNSQLCIRKHTIQMPKPFVPDNESRTVPVLPMLAISFVTFLGNMCYSLVNPNIPYMTKHYFPDVFHGHASHVLDRWHRNWLLLRMDYGWILAGRNSRKLFLGLVLRSVRTTFCDYFGNLRLVHFYQHFRSGRQLLGCSCGKSVVGFLEWQSGRVQDVYQWDLQRLHAESRLHVVPDRRRHRNVWLIISIYV